MKRTTRIALAAATLVAVTGAIAVTAQADNRWQGGERFHKEGAKHGGPEGRDRMMKMFESFDTNGDGALTQDEINGARVTRFTAFDANGDKVLTLEEFQGLWLDAARERMVDGFQRLDADGE